MALQEPHFLVLFLVLLLDQVSQILPFHYLLKWLSACLGVQCSDSIPSTAKGKNKIVEQSDFYQFWFKLTILLYFYLFIFWQDLM